MCLFKARCLVAFLGESLQYGSDSEGSLISDQWSCSPETDPFSSPDGTDSTKTFNVSPTISPVISRPSTVSSLYSLSSPRANSHLGDTSNTTTDYDCSSLPSSTSRKKRFYQRNRSTSMFNSTPLNFLRSGSMSDISQLVSSPSKTVSANPHTPLHTESSQLSPLRLSESRASLVSLRSMALRRQHETSKHVAMGGMENSDLPQLVGLRRLCNDFRNSCLQQNLEQRRKSIDRLINPFDPITSRPILTITHESTDSDYDTVEVVLEDSVERASVLDSPFAQVARGHLKQHAISKNDTDGNKGDIWTSGDEKETVNGDNMDVAVIEANYWLLKSQQSIPPAVGELSSDDLQTVERTYKVNNCLAHVNEKNEMTRL